MQNVQFGAVYGIQGKLKDVQNAVSLIKADNQKRGIPTADYLDWERTNTEKIADPDDVFYLPTWQRRPYVPPKTSRETKVQGRVIYTGRVDVDHFIRIHQLLKDYNAEKDQYEKNIGLRQQSRLQKPTMPADWLRHKPDWIKIKPILEANLIPAYLQHQALNAETGVVRVK